MFRNKLVYREWIKRLQQVIRATGEYDSTEITRKAFDEPDRAWAGGVNLRCSRTIHNHYNPIKPWNRKILRESRRHR
jgi:hypothetical protein